MRKTFMGAIALAWLTTTSCAPLQPNYPDLKAPIDDANDLLRRGRAVAAAQAVITTQLALHHLLAAVNRAAAEKLGAAQPFVALGSPDPTAVATYTLDAAAGTGGIDVTRGGEPTMDIDFQFEQVPEADGFRIRVTEATGTVEGFAFASEGMSVLFRDAAAGWRADVDLRARLAHDDGDVRTAIARLALPGAKVDPGAVLGSLEIQAPKHEALFNGTIMASTTGTPVTRGGLDVAGVREYDVRLAADNTIEIKPTTF